MWCFLSWQSIQCTTINGAGPSVILAKHLPLIIIQLKKDICCASIDFLNMQFIGLWWTLAWDSDSCNPHETYIVYVCSCGTWGLVPLIYSKTIELEGTATNVTKTHTCTHICCSNSLPSGKSSKQLLALLHETRSCLEPGWIRGKEPLAPATLCPRMHPCAAWHSCLRMENIPRKNKNCT